MQLLGILLLFGVIGIGFMEREMKTVTTFDIHALAIILLGSLAAILVSSSATTAKRTLLALRELVPGLGVLSKETDSMERERSELSEMWRGGRRAQALELAQGSAHASTKSMLDLLLKRAKESSSGKIFTELRHEEMGRWQPAFHNWEMLAKLGPSFGMVGTITGMIQLFKSLGETDANMGAAMSLALLATLYGVAFGAGIAGPIGQFLSGILDERLGVLERCEKSVNDLVGSGEG